MIYAIFFDGFLAFNLIEIEISENYVGYFLSLFASMYTLIAFFVGPLIKRFGAKKVSLCSYLTIALGCILMGPSNVILPNNCYS